MIGTTVAHYRIIEKLGEGGMGLVFRAHDTRLDRDVALKFLPPTLSPTGKDTARFAQEARTASSLNHPNVCTIHDIQEHEGRLFIVMEFVDGQTLRDLLEARPGSTRLPMKRALEIGVQIADGLAAAHEKGIIHRDIKPENIMIRKDGIVQIMDFGLAKLRGVSRLTKEGSTVGTAGYMSPEQVQGLDADHRSDIFSFGVVLYELLTGRLPFSGVHETALMYEIVNVDPQPLSAVAADVDPALDAIVLECMEKDPAERYQSVAEAGKDLRRLKRESTRVSRSSIAPAGGPARSPVTRHRAWMWPLVSGALAVLSLALIVVVWRGGGPVQTGVIRFPIMLPLTSPVLQGASTLAISPDGRSIAYLALDAGTPKLYVRPMENFDARPIAGTEGAVDPFFSPDGQWVAYFAAGKLKKVSIFGGAPQDICDVPAFMRGGWWDSNGMIWYGNINDAIFRVAAAGGTPAAVTSLDSAGREISHRYPQPLPDNETVVFTVKQSTISSFDEAVIAAENIRTKKRAVLIRGGSYARYLSTGHLLYARGNSVYAVAFDAGSLTVEGAALPVIEGGMLNQLSGQANFEVSGSGVLVYVPLGAVSQDVTTVAWMDRSGRTTPVLDSSRTYDEVALSPDGERVAMTIRAANDDIWIHQRKRGTLSRLTFGRGNSARAAWTPDGKRLAYLSETGKAISLFWKAWDGSAAEEHLAGDVDGTTAPAFTPDGRSLVFAKKGDLWVMALDSTRESRPLFRSEAFESEAKLSPDGGLMCYFSNESGRRELYVVPFPRGEGKWQIPTNSVVSALWSRDGRELIYLDGQSIMKVDIVREPTFDFSRPRKVCDAPATVFVLHDITPDGSNFVVSLTRFTEASPTRVNVVVGWFEELRRSFTAAGTP